ncbi:MAG: cytochrome b5 domain-containing protein [Candidatus Deferrimicrobiaceae bacterium]
MRRFTREELARANGEAGAPAFIASKGKVYDVSGMFLWKGGKHFVVHMADTDLTGGLEQASHGENMLKRCPIIGELAEI